MVGDIAIIQDTQCLSGKNKVSDNSFTRKESIQIGVPFYHLMFRTLQMGSVELAMMLTP